jgi:hypothetical protein
MKEISEKIFFEYKSCMPEWLVFIPECAKGMKKNKHLAKLTSIET